MIDFEEEKTVFDSNIDLGTLPPHAHEDPEYPHENHELKPRESDPEDFTEPIDVEDGG